MGATLSDRLPLLARRRVPGHQRCPVRASSTYGGGGLSSSLRRGRRRSDHLRMERRQRPPDRHAGRGLRLRGHAASDQISAARRPSSRPRTVSSSTTPAALLPSALPSRRSAAVRSPTSRFGVVCSRPTGTRRQGLRPRSRVWTSPSAGGRSCWPGPARCWSPCVTPYRRSVLTRRF